MAHVARAALAALAALTAAGPAWGAWQNFSTADGLAALGVVCVAEDSSESMWFGTSAGASRYDGAAFRTFRMADGLASGNISAICTDRTGNVWFGTDAGVSRFDGRTWNSYAVGDGLAGSGVSCILEDRAGRMWFGTGNGASRFDGTNWVSFHQSDGLAADQVTCMTEDHAGNLWIGTAFGGASRFDGSAWTTYSTAQGLASNWVECILETRDGVMWFGTQTGGLSRFNGSSWSTVTTAGTLSLADVIALREGRDGTLWAGARAGVARFDGLSWRAYTVADGISSSLVSALTIDGSGNVWVGGDNGASRYDGESFTAFTDAGLGIYGAKALLEDRSGGVWAATNGFGVAHYDRASWTSLRAAPGELAGDRVAAVLEDSTGALWFGTTVGASRYDGVLWSNYTVAEGLAGNNVTAMARDSAGAIWLGTTTGLSRYDGVAWTKFNTSNGLGGDAVLSLSVDNAGHVWCGTTAGVSSLSGATWTNYNVASGLANARVYAVHQDRSGAMWFGTQAGLTRFDGVTWTSFKLAQGLAADWVYTIAEDRDGVLWIGTNGGGVSRFDGSVWHTYTTAEGLPDNVVSAAIVEHSGNLWFGTLSGAVLYEPLRVPPQTVITSPAPALSTSTLQTVNFVAAFRQIVGIEFSTSLDNASWSGWSTDNAWFERNISDGIHRLQIRSRDALQHVDPTPATCTFEVDATGPVPTLTSPGSRQAVRDTLVVEGTATDARFRSLRVDLRPAGALSWEAPIGISLAQSSTPVVDGELARFATRTLPDGEYEVRVAVADTLGLTGDHPVTFIIDNEPPWATETTPAVVSAEAGGDVSTTHREAHVYIPPHALAHDAIIHIDTLASAAVPGTMPDGAIRLGPARELTLAGVPLAKAITLDLSVAGLSPPAGARLVIYMADEDPTWRRLGGTLDAQGARIAAPISGPLQFAICAQSSETTLPGAALSLSLTPRVFSHRGQFVNSSIGIGFVLARTGAVNITIHNRAGRLVRRVMAGTTLGAGSNLVSWDGRDEDRREVEEGLYLVTVEALGESRVRALAVVK